MISLQYRPIIERGRKLSYAAELSNTQDNNNICGDHHISKSGGFNKLPGVNQTGEYALLWKLRVVQPDLSINRTQLQKK